MNRPYRKATVNGVRINPITKEDPYLNNGMNRRARRKFIKNLTKKTRNGKRN